MDNTALRLASELCGIHGEDVLLEALCDTAERAWEGRLKGGVSREACAGALICAAAFTAVADYLGKQASGGESFTVGDVTVKNGTGQSLSVQAEELRRTAERLMEPYAVSGSFCFKGARG